jgi:hypothetical protein
MLLDFYGIYGIFRIFDTSRRHDDTLLSRFFGGKKKRPDNFAFFRRYLRRAAQSVQYIEYRLSIVFFRDSGNIERGRDKRENIFFNRQIYNIQTFKTAFEDYRFVFGHFAGGHYFYSSVYRI